MIESPLIQELMAAQNHGHILRFLKHGSEQFRVELTAALQAIQDETKLKELLDWAAECPDLDAFRARLST